MLNAFDWVYQKISENDCNAVIEEITDLQFNTALDSDENIQHFSSLVPGFFR